MIGKPFSLNRSMAIIPARSEQKKWKFDRKGKKGGWLATITVYYFYYTLYTSV